MTRLRPHGLRPGPRSRAALVPTLLGALAVSLLPACDNPACIFGAQGPDGCLSGGGSSGSSATSATFPAHGEWITAGAPQVESMFPQGTANPESPIVLVFSESISPASISGAFELNQVGGISTGPNSLTGQLVGDGRVLVLFPPALIGGSEYELSWADGGNLRDLTGSLALRPVDGIVGSFSVDDAPGDLPQIVMTWPLDSTVGQSPITEIVTVFDRLIDPTTVLPTSWRVRVNGAEPTFNPNASALSFDTSGFGQTTSTQEPRVWLWRSVDTTTDLPANLGLSSTVSVQLSPDDGSRIATPDGDELAASSINFTTQVYAPPTGSTILSDPTDAIGLDNFNGAIPLQIQVDLESPATAGDVLEIWEFGTLPGSIGPDPDDPEGPPLTGVILSLARSVTLDEGAASIAIGNNELQLLESSNPITPRFLDGDLGFAFSISRGGTSTPVTVLDVDTDTAGIQDALLDTVPPEFLGLAGLPALGTDYRGDGRDLVVVGQADEQLSSVEVIATLSSGTVDNRVGSQLPPLPAMQPSGDFIAAPVFLDAVDASELPVDFSVIVYDRALNASQPYFARWTQLGATGPAAALPGTGLDVKVTVYDTVTLEPVVGAVVYSHEVVAGALTAFAPQPVATNGGGVAWIASAPTGETIITVEAAGYDLFSYQDVRTVKLDVPLISEGVIAAVVQPAVLGTGEDLSSDLLTTWIADSRALLPGSTVHQGNACSYNPLTNQSVCSFTPAVIFAGRMGLLTFMATKEPASQTDPNAFSASSFLQAYETSFPRPRVQAGGLDTLPVQVDSLLSGADVDPEDVPLGAPNYTLEKPFDFGTAFPNLVGSPSVSVEVVVRGLPGSMTVGLGKSYENVLNDNYDLRAAYSALAGAGGPYAESSLMRDERYLRTEFVDISGARTGTREAFSLNSTSLTPLPQPLITMPAGTVSGTSYSIVYSAVIRGPIDGQGIVRLTLTDGVGRTWQVWQPDPTGTDPTVTAFLPPIDLAGGAPLADGPVTCVVNAWVWPSFDPAQFLFSDPAREHDLYLSTAPTIWAQQP